MSILLKVQEYTTEQLTNNILPEYTYHDLAHTQRVVAACEEICLETEISDDDKEVLLIAAWFHDLGYIESAKEHEKRSMQLAEESLLKNQYPQEKISKVKKCINATCLKTEPKDLIELIIKDADLVSLGKESFFDRGLLLKKEWSVTEGIEYTDEEWIDINIDFLSKHSYYTEYAKKKFGEQKKKNIETLIEKQGKLSLN